MNHKISALATARIEGLVSESKHSATSLFPLRYSIFTLRYLLLFPVQTHTSPDDFPIPIHQFQHKLKLRNLRHLCNAVQIFHRHGCRYGVTVLVQHRAFKLTERVVRTPYRRHRIAADVVRQLFFCRSWIQREKSGQEIRNILTLSRRNRSIGFCGFWRVCGFCRLAGDRRRLRDNISPLSSL